MSGVGSQFDSLPMLPPREATSHKGNYGRALLVGGSRGMTGAISLAGLAALRGGVTTVIIPKDNEKDLVEIPEVVKKGLDIIIATTVDEVLQHSLVKPLVPIEWNESDNDSRTVAEDDDDSDASGVVQH